MGKKKKIHVRGTLLSQVTLLDESLQKFEQSLQKMSKLPILNSVPVQTFQVKNTRKSRKLNSV